MQQTQIIANQTASITTQTRLLDSLLSIAAEPAVRLLSSQTGPVLSGVFTFQLVNNGAPTITDIDIGKEFYLLRDQTEGRLKQIQVGGNL